MSGYYPNHMLYFFMPSAYYQAMQAQKRAQAWQQAGHVQQEWQSQQTQTAAHVHSQHPGDIQQPQTIYPANANAAYAMLTAGPDYPSISGLITFADIPGGVMVCADVQGLPPYKPASGEKGPVGPFGFHIHEMGMCEIGDPEKPFEGCGGHWNPTDQPHGNHAGDFPVLVAGSTGRAKMCFITDRFMVDEILGRSVMIHENPDDYRSQPSGNSGRRIACGQIKPWNSFMCTKF